MAKRWEVVGTMTVEMPQLQQWAQLNQELHHALWVGSYVITVSRDWWCWVQEITPGWCRFGCRVRWVKGAASQILLMQSFLFSTHLPTDRRRLVVSCSIFDSSIWRHFQSQQSQKNSNGYPVSSLLLNLVACILYCQNEYKKWCIRVSLETLS